ncbi:hypothetical protein SAMN05444006_10753 [Allgaiera indica]|uniref:DUF6538 domain-containing protein n=1 Tax=Allgaiera indica TaxID=765699 RepID=A0A1H2WRX9_9RHOB|nr:hypothetical protein SAMN05444006_10753 [Allgaiera indica]
MSFSPICWVYPSSSRYKLRYNGSGKGVGDYLIKQGQKWSVKVSNPADVQHIFGKHALKQALKTSDKAAPIARSGPLVAKFKDAIEEARGNPTQHLEDYLAHTRLYLRDAHRNPNTEVAALEGIEEEAHGRLLQAHGVQHAEQLPTQAPQPRSARGTRSPSSPPASGCDVADICVLAQLGHRALRDAAQPHGLHQAVAPPGGDAADPGLLERAMSRHWSALQWRVPRVPVPRSCGPRGSPGNSCPAGASAPAGSACPDGYREPALDIGWARRKVRSMPGGHAV